MKSLAYPIVATLLLAALPLPALSTCPDKSKVVFSCTIRSNSKHVEVCDTGGTITYSFGRPGLRPELAFASPRDLVTTHQWKGLGPQGYTVDLPNGNTTYSVYIGSVVRDGYPDIEAGMNVVTPSRLVQLYCNLDTLEQDLEGIDLKEAE